MFSSCAIEAPSVSLYFTMRKQLWDELSSWQDRGPAGDIVFD